MPVALERKLNKQAKRKGLKKKSKDAYVYGTLRKTGWKPKREMTAMDKITYLQDINKKLDTYFQYENEDEKKNKTMGSALRTGALAGGVGTGLYGVGAMKAQGLTAGQTLDKAKQNLTSIGRGGAEDAWSAVRQGAGIVKKYGVSAGGTAWQKIMAIVKNRIPKFEANGKEIRFGNWYVLQKPFKRVPGDISDKELDKHGGVALNPSRLAGSALVAGGLGYGGYQANKLVKYGGGYKKVGKDLLDAAKRGFRK